MARDDVARVLDVVRKGLGKDLAATLQRLGDTEIQPVDVVSTGSMALDHALGVGGFPLGRIVEVYGPESCLDAGTFVSYEVRMPDGHRANHKGGTIERLWERFHGRHASGDGRGKYLRPATVGARFFAASINEDGRVFQNPIVDVVATGEKPCFELVTLGGQRVVATAEHKFFTGEAYVELATLEPGQRVMVHNNTPYRKAEVDQLTEPERERVYLYVAAHPVAGVKVVRPNAGRSKGRGYEYTYYRLARSRAVVEAEMNRLSLDEYVRRLNACELEGLRFLEREQHVHHKDEDHTNDMLSNLMVITPEEHGRLHALERHNNLRFAAVPDVVASVVPVGSRRTFDLRMESPFNNYVADGFVVHNSGKTTLALHAMAEAQKRGLVCGFVDAEHALDVGYAKALGVVTDDLLLSQPDNGEQGLDMVERLIEAGAGVVVVDSVAALVPKAEIDGDMGDAHMGLQARLMSQAMRKLTGVTFKSNALVIFINQIRMKIGVLYGSPETTSGGNALKFYASVRIDVRRIGKVGEDKVTTGVHTRAKVVKNKLAPPFREAEFDITFGKGIDRDLDLLVVAEALEVVDKAGSWYSFAGEKLAQGREAVGAVLAGNPELRAKLEAAVRERVRKKPTAAA